jgi:exopolyphosphatase/guanosine-5'-triphosphate,3'-diphosphate pyrophosphatase
VTYACIDIGSNTTRLLVAELSDGRPRDLMTQRAFTSIGKSLSRARIPPEKIEETAEVVARQARLARELGADAIAVVATAAVRAAKNRDEFEAAVADQTRLPVRVLTGDEEARLASPFASARASWPTATSTPIRLASQSSSPPACTCRGCSRG